MKQHPHKPQFVCQTNCEKNNNLLCYNKTNDDEPTIIYRRSYSNDYAKKKACMAGAGIK